MNPEPQPGPAPDSVVRLRLGREAGYPDLLAPLHDLTSHGRYRILLDVSAVSHFGTTEFRLLGIHAQQCQEHGGFLKLVNASAKLAALACSYGYSHLLSDPVNRPPANGDGAASGAAVETSASGPARRRS